MLKIYLNGELEQSVYDVAGAGDTVIAVMGLALSAGADMAGAAFIANMAAGVVVGKLGVATLSRKELLDKIDSCEV